MDRIKKLMTKQTTTKIPQPTEGNWFVSDEREVGRDHFATVIAHGGAHPGTDVARLHGLKPYRDGEGMANAYVLAAAKDCLEVVEGFMKAMQLSGVVAEKDSFDPICALLYRAEKARAKARGVTGHYPPRG